MTVLDRPLPAGIFVPPPSQNHWRPLLEGEEAAQAWEAIRSIAGFLDETPRVNEVGPGLSGGWAGLAVFYAYLAEADPGRGWERRAGTYLARASEAVGAGVLGPDLFAGFTGIAWAAEHLETRLAQGGGNPGEAIDPVLLEFLARQPWTGDYDLILGLVGYGVYALESQDRPLALELLARVVDRLWDSREVMPDGLSWRTLPNLLPSWQRELHPEGYFDLGLAHGVPGVIALLGRARRIGVRRERVDILLEGAVRWLMAQKAATAMAGCFGNVVSIGRTRTKAGGSRLAWCYGDLGLAVALLSGARDGGRQDWESTALEVARGCATRSQGRLCGSERGLCHGAAGIGHLFNRLWHATGEATFRNAAHAWIHETLAYPEPGQVEGPGLLEGAAGVGLALLAAVSAVEPSWDRILLVDLEPQGC